MAALQEVYRILGRDGNTTISVRELYIFVFDISVSLVSVLLLFVWELSVCVFNIGVVVICL